MIPKKISTVFSHGPEVGGKCSVIRGFRASHAYTAGCLCVRGRAHRGLLDHDLSPDEAVGLRLLPVVKRELDRQVLQLLASILILLSARSNDSAEGGEHGVAAGVDSAAHHLIERRHRCTW